MAARGADPVSLVTPDSLVAAIRKGRLTAPLWRAALSSLPPPRLLRTAELLSGAPAEAAALIGHAAYHRRDYALAAAALHAARAAGRSGPEELAALAHALAVLGRGEDAAAVVSALAGMEDAAAESAWASALLAVARGEHATALKALQPISPAGSSLPFGIGRDQADWIIGHLEAGLGRKPTRAAAMTYCLSQRWSSARRADDADIVFGILDYKSSDLRGSGRNIDDWIQTAAVLRHIMRFRDVSWSFDDPGLKRPAESLEVTWQAHERRPSSRARIHVAVLDRDEPWPAAHIHADSRIWLVVNGWFMHSAFDLTRGLPFPENVQPIFVGFHLAVADHLDDRLVKYLKEYEPIGCRDWATVWWLLSRGIDAFFSGCLTLTLAGETLPDYRQGRIAVDVADDAAAAQNGERMTHQADPEFRIGPALGQALNLLARYATAEQVVTTRLHAYLACLAYGTPVTLDAKMAGERRFDGLDDLTPEQVADFRGRLTRSMDAILGWILSRSSAKDVGQLWRSINAGLVEQAKARFRAAALPANDLPPVQVSKRKRSKTPPPTSATVVLTFDGAYAPHVPPLVRSCAALASIPVEFIFVVRNVEESALGRLEAATAGCDTHIIRADESGSQRSPVLDRLYLPELLPTHDRIISLDVDTLFLGDVAELAAQEVSEAGLGARADPNAHGDILAKLFELPANRGTPPQAKEFRLFTAANLDLWAPALEPGVLVLSLEALRRHDFTRRTTALVEQFGVPAAVALNAYAGGRFALLPKAWNTMPQHEWPDEPKLVHFRGPVKPWTPNRTPRFGEQWRAHVADDRPLAVVPSPTPEALRPETLLAAIRHKTLTPALWRPALANFSAAQLLEVAASLYAAPACPAEAAALIGHAAYGRRDYVLAAAALTAARTAGRAGAEETLLLVHALATLGQNREAEAVAATLAETPEAAWLRALLALAEGSHEDALSALQPIAGADSVLPFGIGRDRADWLIGYLESGLGRTPTRASAITYCLSQRWSSARRADDADIIFGILDYKSSDLRRAGRSIDDCIQTTAMLRHLVRFQGASWSFDDPGLKRPAERLEATWQAHERRPAHRARIHVAVLDRDEPWPTGHIHAGSKMWLIVDGEFGRASFDLPRGLPFPENIHPIFAGFHLGSADHLDDGLVEYLKSHEPIGCRDWATVWWLLNRGIDAFFSGCLTLTMAGGAAAEYRQGRIAVDMPEGSADRRAERTTHQTAPDLRIGPAIDQTLNVLERYAQAEEVATTRLHAYLACLAYGTPVVLDPNTAAERHFDGLGDLTPELAAGLRGRLTRSMDAILGWVLSRAAAPDVALLWRSINANLVEEAKARLAAARQPDLPQPARKRRRKKPAGPVAVTVVLTFDGAYAAHVPPLVRSCVAQASVPVEFIFLMHSIDDLVLHRLGAATEGLDIHVVPTDSRHARLRLPELLPNHDRVIVLDVDTLVLGDVADLAAQSVSELGIGARADPSGQSDILAKLFELPPNRGTAPQVREFRRFAAANLDLWAPSLELGVLVLSLEALRRNDFTARTTALVEQFGVSPAVALNVFAGGRFAALPKAWNTMPYYEWPEEPKLVHFRGPQKPWSEGPPPRFGEQWRAYADSPTAKTTAA
jgi:lipopolysaccharide biosynthesis glycosyltransferase